MKLSWMFAVAVTSLAGCASTAEAPRLPGNMISLKPAAAGQDGAIRVGVEITSDDDGVVEFLFPDQWGPETDLTGLLSDFQVSAAGTGATLEREGRAVRVEHDAVEPFELSFALKQDYDGEPQWGEAGLPGMRPIALPGHASLIGYTFVPDVDVSGPFRLSISGFEGAMASSLKLEDGVSEPVALDDIRGSVILIGDYRTSVVSETGHEVRVGVRGDWALSDQKIGLTALAVLSEAAALFEDDVFKDYFVALLPLPDLPDGSAVIGTGLTRSFLLLATQNAEAENLTHTIVHEILHEWITRRMGETDEDTDPERMWFTEGFTEYYTQIVLLKSGLIDLDSFVSNLNDMVEAYLNSPVRETSQEALAAGIWDSDELQKLPYQQGLLLALNWNSELTASNRGDLSDVLSGLIDHADETLDDDEIQGALRAVLADRFDDQYQRHIVEGAVIWPDELALPACLTVQGTGEDMRFAVDADFEEAACVRSITG
ncbi:M61 family metallopeptidase [Henriciella litoralis]|uniref:M61 family metallopeptidase n=1 Tax=Henriciella litoralis TaxID=568102 RepID=UPI000A018EEA|nr:hypothetical protein [Henriciella litoralis]